MGDEAREELVMMGRIFAASCLRVDDTAGPFNAPCGAFLKLDGQVEFWLSVNHHPGRTCEELLALVRQEALARSRAGDILGAGLLTVLNSPDGRRRALGMQIHTLQSFEMLIFECAPDGRSLQEPKPGSPLFQEGLCEFESD